MRTAKRFMIMGIIGMMEVCGFTGTITMARADGADKIPVISGLNVQLYGYARLDAAYDTGRIYPGNYALWVKSAYFNRNDDNQLNITANQTRIGLNLAGPDVLGAKSSGKIEFDFYGGGAENKSNPMLRHGYAELLWPGMDFGILAGQTWDVLEPLAPDTVNFLIGSTAGKIGYRRPQFRLTQGIGLGENAKLILKASASREIGEVFTTMTYKESSVPVVQGSIEFNTPLFAKQPVQIIVSGMKGQENYDMTSTSTYVAFTTWALAADVALPLTDVFTVKGSVWKGANLDAFVGGILQGVNPVSLEAINSQGGWVSLGLALTKDVKINLGATIETPQADQLPIETSPSKSWRTQNGSEFANVIVNLSSAFQAAFEFSYWRTLYKQIEPGTSFRAQTALVYLF